MIFFYSFVLSYIWSLYYAKRNFLAVWIINDFNDLLSRDGLIYPAVIFSSEFILDPGRQLGEVLTIHLNHWLYDTLPLVAYFPKSKSAGATGSICTKSWDVINDSLWDPLTWNSMESADSCEQCGPFWPGSRLGVAALLRV